MHIKKSTGRKIIAAVAALVTFSWGVAYAATSEVGTITLTNPGNTHGAMLWEGNGAVTVPTALSNGQFYIGSTGADPSPATITDGTGISHSTGAGTLTITNAGVTSIIAGTGISRDQATGAVTITATGGGSRTVAAKTTNYTVLSGDSGTFFTNTGAAGTVNYTLPTAAAGLWYTFYTDAVQTSTITAGSSTTIQLGGSTSASAGNITNALKGNSVTLIGIDTTHWVSYGYTGTWTVN